MNPPLIDKRQYGPPAGWLKINDAATAYGLTRGRLDGLIERGEVAVCYVKGMGRNGSVRYVPPPPATVAPEPPATGPLPTAAPLSEFASPTIEVQHTPPPDDHLLDADDPPLAPPSEMRLLAAMQRIGYLEAQLEHWQAEATKLTQELETLQWDFNHLAHDYNELEAQRKPRRWFPWGQA